MEILSKDLVKKDKICSILSKIDLACFNNKK